MPVSLSVLLSLPNIICCFCLAVIDILRMIVLHPDGASLLHKHMESGNGTCSTCVLVTDILMEILVKATTAPPQTANLLTIVRAITNLFKHSCFSNWLQSHYSEVLPSCFTILVLNCLFFGA
ncbi:hypothetical protein B296_00024808 [Ensete ventricosum]|uniref:PUL domain-containing protein n=1 Tax=Ensete ventricosum TaxID=4639 RepID=A0A427AU84_ENSVE|nr:hypothetical protein B296_00024808 [Ensete ventricosum]